MTTDNQTDDMTIAEVCKRAGLSISTFHKLKRDGKGPALKHYPGTTIIRITAEAYREWDAKIVQSRETEAGKLEEARRREIAATAGKKTTMKKRVVSEGRSEGERIAFDLGKYIARLGTRTTLAKDGDFNDETVSQEQAEKIVIDVNDVSALVVAIRGLKTEEDMKTLEKPERLRKMLLAGGLHPSYRDPNGELHRFMIHQRKHSVVANFPISAGTEWDGLKEHHQSLRKLVPDWWPDKKD